MPGKGILPIDHTSKTSALATQRLTDGADEKVGAGIAAKKVPTLHVREELLNVRRLMVKDKEVRVMASPAILYKAYDVDGSEIDVHAVLHALRLRYRHELDPLQPTARRATGASVQAPAEGLRPPGGELLGLGAVDGDAADGDAGHDASVACGARLGSPCHIGEVSSVIAMTRRDGGM